MKLVRSSGALILALLSGPARGASFAGGHLQTGECALGVDPATQDGADAIGVVFCARGNAGAEITAVTGAPKENFWTRFARGSLGAYYGEYLALQGRAHLRDVILLGGPVRPNLERETDLAIAQVGNPVLHRFSLQAGRMPLPFGLDKTWAPESYQRFENRELWASPRYGAALAIDNKVNTRLDLGYAEDPKTVVPRAIASEADPRRAGRLAAGSARLSYDFAALDGSRVVASGYGENHGVRKFGLGLVNVSRRNDTTEVELARRIEEPNGGRSDYQQLLRIAYAGAVRGAGRWVVQFDDERFRFRMGMIGQELRLFDVGLVRIALVYQKSETGDGKKRWMLTTGLGAQL